MLLQLLQPLIESLQDHSPGLTRVPDQVLKLLLVQTSQTARRDRLDGSEKGNAQQNRYFSEEVTRPEVVMLELHLHAKNVFYDPQVPLEEHIELRSFSVTRQPFSRSQPYICNR